jgi:hypothetical protein
MLGFLKKLCDIQVIVGPVGFQWMMCNSFFCHVKMPGFLKKLYKIQVVVKQVIFW